MQHGHPQMTIADLLGNPLPADLVNAQRIEDIRISWRQWLSMRVKIIDEYNRIPTRTQSALLTADLFGATFHRAAKDEFDSAKRERRKALQMSGARVVFNGEKFELPELGEFTSAAANAHTLALTGRFTHAVVLAALQ